MHLKPSICFLFTFILLYSFLNFVVKNVVKKLYNNNINKILTFNKINFTYEIKFISRLMEWH